MIVSIPHTDGEHQACARAPKAILEELNNVLVIESNINNIPDSKIYLGGDHTITYHTVKNLTKKSE